MGTEDTTRDKTRDEKERDLGEQRIRLVIKQKRRERKRLGGTEDTARDKLKLKVF